MLNYNGQSSLGVGYHPHPFSQLLYYIKPTFYIYNTNNKKGIISIL